MNDYFYHNIYCLRVSHKQNKHVPARLKQEQDVIFVKTIPHSLEYSIVEGPYFGVVSCRRPALRRQRKHNQLSQAGRKSWEDFECGISAYYFNIFDIASREINEK